MKAKLYDIIFQKTKYFKTINTIYKLTEFIENYLLKLYSFPKKYSPNNLTLNDLVLATTS